MMNKILKVKVNGKTIVSSNVYRLISFSVCIILVFLFAACSSMEKSDIPDSKLNNLKGVKMTVEQDKYPAGTNEIKIFISNESQEEFAYGTPFMVEQFKDGEWYKVPFKKDASFNAIGIILKPMEQNPETIKFESLANKLKTGSYRIIKQIGEGMLSAEFKIE